LAKNSRKVFCKAGEKREGRILQKLLKVAKKECFCVFQRFECSFSKHLLFSFDCTFDKVYRLISKLDKLRMPKAWTK
jgi:hypothetical protein